MRILVAEGDAHLAGLIRTPPESSKAGGLNDDVVGVGLIKGMAKL